MIFSIPINAENPLEEIQQEGDMFCLTEDQLIELANHIENLQIENELLRDRIDKERESYENLLDGKEETIELQRETITKQDNQINDLMGIIDKREQQIELTEQQLDIRREQLNIMKTQQFLDRLSLIGIGAIGVAILIN